MANSLDGPSFCATKFSGSNYTYMPALPGSGGSDPTGLQKIFMAANSAYESINFIRGLAIPSFNLAAVPHKSWFNATNLVNAFTAKTLGLLASMGPVAYHIGGDVSGGSQDISGHYTNSFWSSLTLSGGGRGSPVSAQVGIMPCGAAAVDSVTFSTPPAGSAGFFMSDGVTFNSILAEVLGWNLTIINLLSPDTACPGPGDVPLGSKIIPATFLNGPIGVMFNAVQRSGGTNTAEDGLLNTLKTIDIDLSSAEISGGTPGTIRFALKVLEPDKSSQITGGLTILNRSWVGQANGVGSGASLVITGS